MNSKSKLLQELKVEEDKLELIVNDMQTEVNNIKDRISKKELIINKLKDN